MEFLNKYNIKPLVILKVAGLGLLIVIVLAFALKLIGSTVSPLLERSTSGISSFQGSAMKGVVMSDGAGYAADEMIGLSTRNVAAIMPAPGQASSGNTAEEYEVTQYYGTIETRDIAPACAAISSLKSKDYVIFENANEHDRGCSYTFKVMKENKDEILNVIKGLDPKELTENIQTIKSQIDDYTSEEEILKKKLNNVELTLESAINSYDEIARVATQARDAESLAKIIDSKINIITRLSNEKISINQQLDRLARGKADQLDRLDYVNFYITVYENKFVDGEVIKDSWKSAIKKFVRDINSIVQDISINLVTVVFSIIQYAIYLLIILIAIKFGWRIGKRIWMK